MELHLTAEERELLISILERRHRELQKEIPHTDHRDFKQTLRQNENTIESLLNRLRGSYVAQAS
jgi:hypothetical protein